MSVTLFVEVEVKRVGRERKSQVVAEAVGMWEARGVLRAFHHFHSSSPFPNRDWLQDQLTAIEAYQWEDCKMNIPVAIVDRLQGDRLTT